MDPLSMFFNLLGAGASGAGALGNFNATRGTKRFFRTNAGTIKPGEDFAIVGPAGGNEGLDPNLNTQLDQDAAVASRDIPFFSYQIAQEQANQQALDQQKIYADRNIAQIEGSPLASAQKYLTEQFNRPGGPEAISQDAFDRIVADSRKEINSSARTATTNNEAAAARTGLSPAAMAALQNQTNNAAAQTFSDQFGHFLSEREKANKQYGLDLSREATSTGSTYNDQYANANITRGSLEQPINYARLGEIGSNFRLAGQGATTAAQQAQSNALLGLGTGAFNIASSNHNAQLAANAANQTSPSTYINPAVQGLTTAGGIWALKG